MVDDGLILETTFLVDLEREAGEGNRGMAHAFLERHPSRPLYVTFTVAGELAAGPSLDERGRWEELLAPFTVLPSSDEVAWTYGRTYRYLRKNGLLIGSNDLWIAATALAYRLPLVTRNREEFERVPNLDVLGYGEGT